MSILIVKLDKIIFRHEDHGLLWVTGKAGKEFVLIEFIDSLYDLPKILKTVEYKVIGEYRKMSNGNKIFSVDKYDRVGKVKFLSSKLHPVK